MVSGGIADIFQVIVLAPGTHTFLRRGCPDIIPFVFTEEYPFKLHHSCIDKQQRRIILGHQ